MKIMDFMTPFLDPVKAFDYYAAVILEKIRFSPFVFILCQGDFEQRVQWHT